MSRRLDAIVEGSHRIRILGYRYHPYFLATDAAIVVSLAAAFALIRRGGEISFAGFLAVFVAMLALYRAFLWFKAGVLGIPSRSFLQDSVLFILPAYAVVGGIIRIGRFLGGCCYGMP